MRVAGTQSCLCGLLLKGEKRRGNERGEERTGNGRRGKMKDKGGEKKRETEK